MQPQQSGNRPLRLLLLFEKEWDAGGFAPLLEAGEIEVFAEGFDLFRFPGNARLLAFDPWAFVERICRRYRDRVDAVVSNNEQFGALIAAVVAQRLGLPGNDPSAVCRAHHKLLARQVQDSVAPEASIAAAALPMALDDPRVRDPAALAAVMTAAGIRLPAFIKPIKATFSVLARTVRSPEELARHLDFGRFERLVIRRLVAPFAQLAARYVTMPCDPTRMIVEEPVDAHQVNVDGYVFDGEVRVIGIVDEWMYAGERAGALRRGVELRVPALRRRSDAGPRRGRARLAGGRVPGREARALPEARAKSRAGVQVARLAPIRGPEPRRGRRGGARPGPRENLRALRLALRQARSGLDPALPRGGQPELMNRTGS